MLKNTEADLRPGKQQRLMLGAFGGPQMLADTLHAGTGADDDEDDEDECGVDRKDDMYAAMAMKDSPASAAGLQDGNGFWMAAVSAAGPQMDHHASDSYQPTAVPDYMMHHAMAGGGGGGGNGNLSPVDPQHHQVAAAAAAAAMYQMQADQQVGGGGGGQQEYPWMKEKKTTRKNNHQGKSPLYIGAAKFLHNSQAQVVAFGPSGGPTGALGHGPFLQQKKKKKLILIGHPTF